MPLLIQSFTLGPLENNTYLIIDSQTSEAVIIDPSFEVERVLEEIDRQRYRLIQIWLTHAHFDHVVGVNRLLQSAQFPLPIGLHPADLPLWRQKGGAEMFGVDIDSLPEPSLFFQHGQHLSVGKQVLEVRHTPGHTLGHVIFYSPQSKVVLCGDVIFQGSIGRTDLPGGSLESLLHSIRSQILTLPADTRLLSGHGPATTVGKEAAENPFL